MRHFRPQAPGHAGSPQLVCLSCQLVGDRELARDPELVFGRSGRLAGTPADRKVLLQLPSGLPGWVLGW